MPIYCPDCGTEMVDGYYPGDLCCRSCKKVITMGVETEDEGVK